MMISALLIAIAVLLMIVSVIGEKEALKRKAALEDFSRNAEKYEAVVLDCPEDKGKRSVIIQIRIEEQHRTLVHRCEEAFYRKYKRGDVIPVYLMEEMPADRAVIDGDNRYERFFRTEERLRLPVRILGGISALLGIIFLFL